MLSSEIKENGMSPQNPAEAELPANNAGANFAHEDAVTLTTGWIENLRRAIGLRNHNALKNAVSFRERGRCSVWVNGFPEVAPPPMSYLIPCSCPPLFLGCKASVVENTWRPRD